MSLSGEEELMVYYARLVCSIMSILGALYIILGYFAMEQGRRPFAFRLIMYLSISDLLFSTAMLLGPLKDTSTLCQVQAVVITLFGLATVLWTVSIALTMYLVVLSRSSNVEAHECKMMLVCFGLPVLVAVLPFLTESYGTNLEWCWLGINDAEGPVWQVVVFYGPLWAAFAINSYFYWAIRQYLGLVLDDLVGITEEEREEKRKIVSRLQWYPLVLFFCWLVGTVDCIYSYTQAEPIFVLSLLHYSLGSLQGAGNALVYGCNATVIGEIKRLCCKREEPLLSSN